MALQLGALRDALIDAGARPEMAGRAAEELAAFEDQFDAVRADIAAVRSDLDQGLAAVRAELAAHRLETERATASLRSHMEREFASVRVDIAGLRGEVVILKWMMGALFGLTGAVAIKIFLH